MAEKRTKTTGATKPKQALVSSQVGNYEKHPFFVRKKEQAKAFLKKVGLPPVLSKNTK